jgi:pimeloyl-ACP methyl ester carboxylesterase
MFRTEPRKLAPRFSCLVLLLVGLAASPVRAGSTDFNIQVADIQGDFTVWIPDDLPRVRGLIYILPGSSGNTQHFPKQAYYQQAARSLGFGIVGMGVHGGRAVDYFLHWDKDDAALQRSLDAAAKATGHPELINVPVGLIGHSAGCVASAVIARSNPKRVIAIASGATPCSPRS